MDKTEAMKKKVEQLPSITTRFKKIQGKDGRTWFIMETKIVRFMSPEYVKKVVEGTGSGKEVEWYW